MARFYTGVGSRETPHDIMIMMTALAYQLNDQGWTLRSGAADGADSAFEKGADAGLYETLKEIYIPWGSFSDRWHGQKGVFCLSRLPKHLVDKANGIASQVHPAFDRLKLGAKKLHTRNVFQVLGQTLDNPSKFLVCWAPTDKNGVPKGGTRTAWVLAEREGVECFNLYNDADRQRIEQWLEG